MAGLKNTKKISERQQLTEKLLADLRLRLLDLSNKNRLLNYKFSERARSHVRVIDELPDQLHTKLVQGKSLTFAALPPPDETPQDEELPLFQMALETALMSDEQYKKEMSALEDEDETSQMGYKAERELRDRVRKSLGMPARTTKETLDPVAYARSLGFNPSYDLPKPSPGKAPGRHLDDLIQTRLFPEQMEAKLSGLREGYRIHMSETGVNTLYAAFGYLEWYDDDSSETRLFAPLLLHPLEINRTLRRGVYKYSIKSNGDDSEINITLKERLLKSFGLNLPRLEDDDTPESYFHKVNELISVKSRWSVKRFVCVGLFPFSRIAMYYDLDPENWPDDNRLSEHPLLTTLLAGTDLQDPLIEHDVDRLIEQKKIPLLIADADSSQICAIADVAGGKDLVIKGPPGTGKSQTITNIIASALAEKRRVLFIAEKMAALDVVKKRLDDAGIGDFCLELHSAKACRKTILKSLADRLEMASAGSPFSLEDSLDENIKLASELREYSLILNTNIGRNNKTIHDVLWAAMRNTSKAKHLTLPKPLTALEFEDAHLLEENDISEKLRTLRLLESMSNDFSSRFGILDSHPWAWIQEADASPFEQQEFLARITAWHSILEKLELCVLEMEDITGINTPLPIKALEQIRMAPRILSSTPHHLRSINFASAVRVGISALKDFALGLERYKELQKDLQSYFEADVPRNLEIEGTCPQIESITDFVAKAKNSINTVGALQEYATRCKDYADKIDLQAAMLKKLVNIVELNIPLTTTSICIFLDLIELLQRTPRHVLLKRNAAVVLRINESAIRKAASRSQVIATERDMLHSLFSFADTDDAKKYTSSAEIVRATGFWGRIFSRQFRRAYSFWRGIRRTRLKATYHTVAIELDTLADFLNSYHSFIADPKMPEICAGAFSGTDTDFDELIQVSEYGHEVARLASGVISRDIERICLESSLDQIESLCAEAPSDLICRIRSFIEDLRNRVAESEDLDLASLRSFFVGVSEKAQYYFQSLKAFGLHNEVELSCLPDIIKKRQELFEIERILDKESNANKSLCCILNGIDTDSEDLREIVHITEALNALDLICPLIGSIQSAFSSASNQITNLCDEIGELLKEESKARASVAETSFVDWTLLEQRNPLGSISATSQILGNAICNETDLDNWLTYKRLRRQAETLSLSHLLECYENLNTPFHHLDLAFNLVYNRSLLKKAYVDYPKLNRFHGPSLASLRTRFQDIDKKIIELQRLKLRFDLSKSKICRGVGSGPKRHWTNLALIKNEIAKKQQHIPLRQLVLRAGTAIQEMKPCWMMSPASVASHLPTYDIKFDLVVIDEASQMMPEEALGAIARSKQLVVVGDQQQLPPTQFFQPGAAVLEDDDEAVDSDPDKSILDLSLSTMRCFRELRWHYRSRHESLIAFSNKHFYDDRLIIFPSPWASHDDYGVEYHKVEGIYTQKPSINQSEIQAVVTSAIEFMTLHPSRSLGIVTMNKAQSEILQQEMDRAFLKNDKVDEYLRKWEATLEPFFVKNLENVQGDERDVIFISTVYGPMEKGGRVAQRFGPINSSVGHRRLNVLFTRAKEKVVVFSSMDSSDVLVGTGAKQGVIALKEYLAYAQTGQLDRGEITVREPDSDFEIFVADALRAHGFEVVPQIGVAGYFIDIGIRHPKNSDRYLLGIECDGRSYHSSKSARDRDRLREEILKAKKWNLYRIWSTDWFKNPKTETERLLTHINTLM